MSSPPLRAPSAPPGHNAPPPERVIDVRSDGPAILRSSSSRSMTDEEANSNARDDDEDESMESDALEDADDDDHDSGLTELELNEHEYRRGRHAIPMQSPGDEVELDLDAGTTTGRRRSRARLPVLRKKRQFFDGDDASSREYGRAGSRSRILQRIAFRRRKRGEDDTFWTGIFISNVLSLAVMCVLVIYLTQTDFFESHQNDLFGTTVDDRFTVVSPESADAKIYMKTGYSSSRYSEAMIAFGNGELKIGRRALTPTDAQPFYGVSLASNGTATFTNKVDAPFIKSDYVYATRALVFDDGSSMTTAANLTGGISEVGDLNLVSKEGTITLSAGGKRVLVIDPDATVNVMNNNAEDPEGKGVTVDAAKGDISIAGTFKLHNDQHSTVISSRHPIQFNSTKLVVGAANSSRVILTCPPPSEGNLTKKSWGYKPMTLAIVGQSSENQSHGGIVEISGGDGASGGGDVVISGGVSTDSEDDDVTRGSVLLNAKLDHTDKSITEIGSHSASHQVNLHGSVTINNGTESGHGTSLFVGGSSMLMKSKNVTIDNAASNTSTVSVKSSKISLDVAGHSSLVLDVNASRLTGSETVVLRVDPVKNKTQSAELTLHQSGTIELNATKSIKMRTTSVNASTTFFGKVQFGSDAGEEDVGSPVADLTVDDGVVAIDADTLTVGAAGVTEVVSVKANRIRLGDTGMKSNVTIAGDHARVSSKHIHVGSTASQVDVSGHEVSVVADASIRISGGNSSRVSLDGDKVQIGGAAASSVEIGASSTVTIGTSAKSVTVGDKATAIKIGSANTAVEILGKVTVNGHVLDSSRRLQQRDTAQYGIAEMTGIAEQLPSNRNDFQIPIALGFLSTEDFASVVDSSLEIGTSTMKHLRMGLSLDNVRLSISSEASTRMGLLRLRCRVYKVGEPSSVALEVVSQLDTCSSGADCDAGFFLGASSQRIVPVQAGDRFTVRCAVSSAQDAPAILLIDRVQLDFSSSV